MRIRIFIGLLLGLTISLSGQDQPKLGLVLSGGGAKGMAHIGVLKAMEKAGLRPDFIAGTSMGSIVGGLYAIGYSADEIDSIMRGVDWDLVLSNKMPLDYIAFEEKEYYDRYLLEFPMEGFRPKIGTGLIRGQMLSELMNNYLWPSLQYDSFDDFPIPFRCVATDVNSGEARVFKEGSLAGALRASMAIPSAFTAVNRGDTILVDGGAINNFPVELAQARGMDYIIGVNVGTRLGSAVEGNMTEILMHLSMLESTKKLPKQIEACDIYIQPDLTEYNASSFSKASEILSIGDSTGKSFQAALHKLAEHFPEKRAAFSQRGKDFLMDVDSIEVVGNQLFSASLIRKKLGVQIGQAVHRIDLEQGLRRVFGTNGFKNVDYGFYQNAQGQQILRIKVLEKEKNYLFGSLHADNLFSAGLVLNYTSRDLLGPESRSIFTVDISRNPRFRFDYYKYFSRDKRFALNFRYDYEALQIPIYQEGNLQDINLSFNNRLQLNILTTQSLKESYAVGVFHERVRSILRIGNETPEGLRYSNQNTSGLRFFHTANDLNDRNFPTKGAESIFITNFYFDNNNGVALETGVDSIQFPTLPGIYFSDALINEIINDLSPEPYFDILWSYRRYSYLTKNWQLIPYGGIGLSFGEGLQNSIVQGFRLGGMQRVQLRDIRVLGLQVAEGSEANFALAGLQLQYVSGKNVFLRMGLNALYTHPYNAWHDWQRLLVEGRDEQLDFLLGIGLEGVLKTFFGPISVGISTNQQDWKPRYYVGLGFSFNYSD